MTNRELVENLYKKSNTWLLKCAYNLTGDKEQAQELLQDVYLHLLEMPNIDKIIFNKTELNLLYIYRMVKTKYLNNISKNKTSYLNTEMDIISEEYDYASDEEFERKLAIVNHELSNDGEMFWFDKKLFSVYIDEDHSLTSLSEATKISRSAVWNSISKVKKHIKTKANI